MTDNEQPGSGSPTRRISVSSADISNAAREPAKPSSMHTSVASLQSEGTRRARAPRPMDYGSMQGSTSSRQRVRSPQAPQTPRRPTLDKRAPSSAAPHRGEKFSVDDDPDEVGDDLRLARKQSKQEQQRERQQLKTRDSTVRRRPTAQAPTLARVESEETDDAGLASGNDAAGNTMDNGDPGSDETLRGEEEEEESAEDSGSPDPDEDLSDAESFTLKDRQEAINETHPFGIRIWKPALYKKNRSVQRNAEGDIHSTPGGHVSRAGWFANTLWSFLFGWWLALITFVGGLICILLSAFGIPGCHAYGRVLVNLAHYLFYPFGKYVLLEYDEAYQDEDEGEGRSISEYEQWQTGDIEQGRLFFGPTENNRSIIGRRREEVEDPPLDENDPLLARTGRSGSDSDRARAPTKNRPFGRGQWNLGRVMFFLVFYVLITPCFIVVHLICWFLVFSIPMGKVADLLWDHLRRHPLALSFHTDSHYMGPNSVPRGSKGSVIILCTYRAVGWKYWKYTVDGTNIFLINLLYLVAGTIFDYFVLSEYLGIRTWYTSPAFIFGLALGSIIPLAYFIGQAVASISAQSSMGVGATINAFFSTVVEVYLYCIALQKGKGQLVEGSIIGSIFAGILFLPGLSMCFGALKRKTQRFNAKSAGVTSTMLLFAVIAAFSPTLFYQIHGSHELNCHQCIRSGHGEERDCRRCYFSQVPAINDSFFHKAVKPYIWIVSVALVLSYLVGLLFTLRTHAAVIWNNEAEEKKDDKKEIRRHDERHNSLVSSAMGFEESNRPRPPRHDTRDTLMHKRTLNQSLKQAGVPVIKDGEPAPAKCDGHTPHLVPPKCSDGEVAFQGYGTEDNQVSTQRVDDVAATVAARNSKKSAIISSTGTTRHTPKYSREASQAHRPSVTEHEAIADAGGLAAIAHEEPAGGHDAPNWSRTKSVVILLAATVAYAVIAEILVGTVDAILSTDIDEKFLGMTLFALVPNTTEFLNAISFAMNGNVALSMEIGGSYALQVMLLQIPSLVFFSAIYNMYISPEEAMEHSFTLIFPQWDMVTVVLGIILMGWVIGEGKSNYFKGSILILTYVVVTIGFYFVGFSDDIVVLQTDPFDALAVARSETFRTLGKTTSGRAY
ncbi:Hypothetical protein R9X50_00569700 [Acrodontium crateriforme]|uniref:Uncharacterized protein n=1 Tax=Acrodontium crateriforme TaxID=150365 RepID=A0AAQ3M7K1_9PEZI|nr:Hypothetical protein R9X50_00569700 [Acrodontium crateriforme]